MMTYEEFKPIYMKKSIKEIQTQLGKKRKNSKCMSSNYSVLRHLCDDQYLKNLLKKEESDVYLFKC